MDNFMMLLRKRCVRWVMGLLLVLSLAHPAMAQDKKPRPIAMSEVNRLIAGKQSTDDILKQMAERGVSFRVSTTASKRLAKYGFSDDQIELIRKIAAGEEVSLDEPAPAEEGGEGGEEAEAEKAGDFPVGYPNSDGWHNAEKQRVERAVKAAGLGYKRIELTRCTIYCSARRATKLAPMLKQIEAGLIKRFPESLRNASSPKSAHIVVVDGESQWRNWVEACVDSYAKDGINFRFGNEDDPKQRLINGGGYMLRTLAAENANKSSSDQSVARFVAYSLGHLMMNQAGGSKVHNGLVTGFGNLTEVMAHRTPTVTVYSYIDREIGGADGGWKGLTAKRFNDKQITSVSAPWGYETSAMKIEHYAECWSMVSTLAEAPDKFAKTVSMLREDATAMHLGVQEVYQLEDRKLLEAWYKYVSR